MMIKRDRKTLIMKCLFVLPALAVYCYFVIGSIVLAVPYSVSEIKNFLPVRFKGFNNFIRVWKDEIFLAALKNTVKYVITNVLLVTILSIIISVLVYFLFIKGLKGYGFFRGLFLIPATLSSVVVGLMWMFVYHPEIGLLNSLLKFIGLGVYARAWLADSKSVIYMLVITATWQWIGFYVILLFTAIINNVNTELCEASSIDGISDFKMVTKIIIPMIFGTVENCVVLATINAMRSFDLIWIMTKGGPVNASEVIVTYMYRRGFIWGDFNYAGAIGVILLIFSLGLTVVLRGILGRFNYLNEAAGGK